MPEWDEPLSSLTGMCPQVCGCFCDVLPILSTPEPCVRVGISCRLSFGVTVLKDHLSLRRVCWCKSFCRYSNQHDVWLLRVLCGSVGTSPIQVLMTPDFAVRRQNLQNIRSWSEVARLFKRVAWIYRRRSVGCHTNHPGKINIGASCETFRRDVRAAGFFERLPGR